MDSVIKNYYKKIQLNVYEISKREFGIGFNDKIEMRHLNFSSLDELKNFLVDKKPRYISYSSALYEFPGARPMERKNLYACELTFDIDIQTMSKLLTKDELSFAKEQVNRLIDDFLVSDFGISKDKIILNFSGNRGFHVHVYDESIMKLDSDARRQISDYITGKIFNKFDQFFNIKGNVISDGISLNEIGLKNRIAKKFIDLITESNNEFVKLKYALINGNYVGIVFHNARYFKQKLQRIFLDAKKKVFVSIDEKVTFDLSKLIRMPDSIHGSTGLIAKTITIKELDNFNPYEHAIIKFKGEAKVVAKEDIKLPELDLEIQKNKEIIIPIKFAFPLACLNLIDVLEVMI
ncbi:MAG: DNA primase catalytic subunit PriS [Candidatus Anstonellales archaeon]